ncbi:MAG: hypothetical protein E6614_04065 [Bradyrhizobium sp.]|nr:hypothetical protein [Bradyrhizobium sp.]MDU1691670.1 hypothetical protein [Bradyrhizobium sp.]MDU2927791.1 hypothetical protein [Bradyrhizobium sp.]MDU3045474.1 hypothetical protein [Bradyrhizobium sp.]MDU6238143.1 hypothetical protein [Bradyrhizobium sp.]MDU6374670.1 hypothetical protein [Bradyrhizobium sp.]
MRKAADAAYDTQVKKIRTLRGDLNKALEDAQKGFATMTTGKMY